jgi:hypothetical protein
MFVGLVYSFYAFQVVSWIKVPDSLVYTKDYDRKPGSLWEWRKSVLNSNTSTAVYGMTWPFVIGVLCISTLHGYTITGDLPRKDPPRKDPPPPGAPEETKDAPSPVV